MSLRATDRLPIKEGPLPMRRLPPLNPEPSGSRPWKCQTWQKLDSGAGPGVYSAHLFKLMVKEQAHDKTGRNQPCPCGSGKKHKQCCALKEGRSWTSRPGGKAIMVVAGLAIAMLLGYSIAQMGGSGAGRARSSARTLSSAPYYTDANLPEVDFLALNEEQKKAVLDEANTAYCNCGCSLTLAQCVVTDTTCPVRNANIAKIQSEVNKAAGV